MIDHAVNSELVRLGAAGSWWQEVERSGGQSPERELS